jgi:hypothetical protein
VYQTSDPAGIVFSANVANERGSIMADTTRIDPEEVLEEPVPAMQQLLDNPFLLLFIGVAMPTVLYVIWGVMEIVNLPVAK